MIRILGNSLMWVWGAFGILWLTAAFTSKRSVRIQSSGSRLFQGGLMILGIMLMTNFRHWVMSGWLTIHLMPVTLPVFAGGFLLTVAGLLFCIWARVVLGRNWSGTVTIKENHELIVRGPYQIVRHPIYTGLLFALIGTAFVDGYVRSFVGVLVIGFGLWLKSQTEEQFMVQQFGAQYIDYRQHVRALVPFLL